MSKKNNPACPDCDSFDRRDFLRAVSGAALATAYMDAVGEGIDPPYGALIDLAREIDTGRADGYDTADRIRSWRI